MNDSLRVRGAEARGELAAIGDDFSLSKRAVLQAGGEWEAGDQLHYEEVSAVLTGEFVNGFDIGMIDLGESEGFATKEFSSFIVGEHAGWEDFEGDVAVEEFVMSAVDDAHTASADLLDQFVMAECGSDHGGECGGMVGRVAGHVKREMDWRAGGDLGDWCWLRNIAGGDARTDWRGFWRRFSWRDHGGVVVMDLYQTWRCLVSAIVHEKARRKAGPYGSCADEWQK